MDVTCLKILKEDTEEHTMVPLVAMEGIIVAMEGIIVAMEGVIMAHIVVLVTVAR